MRPPRVPYEIVYQKVWASLCERMDPETHFVDIMGTDPAKCHTVCTFRGPVPKSSTVKPQPSANDDGETLFHALDACDRQCLILGVENKLCRARIESLRRGVFHNE